MAIVAYGYGVDSTATGGARLVDFASAAFNPEDAVEVVIEDMYTVTVELPETVEVVAEPVEVTVED